MTTVFAPHIKSKQTQNTPVNASTMSARKKNGDSVLATSNSASSKHNVPIEFGQVMMPSGAQHVMRASEVQQPRKPIVTGNSNKRKQESRGADENNNTATPNGSKIAKLTTTKTSEIVKSTANKISDTQANQTRVPRTKSSSQVSTTSKTDSHFTSAFDMLVDIASSQKKRKIAAVNDDKENDNAVEARSSSTTPKTTRDLKKGKLSSSNEGIVVRRKAAAKPVSYAEKDSDDSDIAEENSDESSVGSLWEGLSDEDADEKLADRSITNDSSEEESDDELSAKKPVKKARANSAAPQQRKATKPISAQKGKNSDTKNKEKNANYVPEFPEKYAEIKRLKLENPKITKGEIQEITGYTLNLIKAYVSKLIKFGEILPKNAHSSTSGPLEEAHEKTIIACRKEGKSNKDILKILSKKYKNKKFSIGQINTFCFEGIKEGTVERQAKAPFVLTPEEKKEIYDFKYNKEGIYYSYEQIAKMVNLGRIIKRNSVKNYLCNVSRDKKKESKKED